MVLSFVLSDGFRHTIVRRREIRRAGAELQRLSAESTALREKLADIERNPHAYEQLVRKELGYLRPGEKEVRFLQR